LKNPGSSLDFLKYIYNQGDELKVSPFSFRGENSYKNCRHSEF